MLRNLRRFARSRSSLSQQHRNSENIPKYAQIERDIESGKTTMYMNKALKSYEDAISDLETKLNDNNITFDDVILPLERMEEEFGTKWRALTHLTYVKNSDMVRETHEKLLPKIIAASSRANQSPEIFQALMKLQSNGQDKSRIVEKRLQDMTLSGVGLPKEKREIFNANKARLSSLSTNFANTVVRYYFFF
jgi:oligopeptidase A